MSSASRRHRRQPTRLIPVPTYATDTAPTVADLRTAGARLFADRDEIKGRMRHDPGLLAAHDQVRAAEQVSIAGMPSAVEHLKALGETASFQEMGPSEEAVAAGLAILTAMLRGVEVRCPHVPWPPEPTGPRTSVSITARAAVCGRPACLTAMLARWHDDSRCELCERETNTFTPCIVPLGPCVVTIELCDDCNGLFSSATDVNR